VSTAISNALALAPLPMIRTAVDAQLTQTVVPGVAAAVIWTCWKSISSSSIGLCLAQPGAEPVPLALDLGGKGECQVERMRRIRIVRASAVPRRREKDGWRHTHTHARVRARTHTHTQHTHTHTHTHTHMHTHAHTHTHTQTHTKSLSERGGGSPVKVDDSPAESGFGIGDTRVVARH
jgi:hypothetical protein